VIGVSCCCKSLRRKCGCCLSSRGTWKVADRGESRLSAFVSERQSDTDILSPALGGYAFEPRKRYFRVATTAVQRADRNLVKVDSAMLCTESCQSYRKRFMRSRTPRKNLRSFDRTMPGFYLICGGIWFPYGKVSTPPDKIRSLCVRGVGARKFYLESKIYLCVVAPRTY
jgi:hypothetical protein